MSNNISTIFNSVDFLHIGFVSERFISLEFTNLYIRPKKEIVCFP